MPDGYKTVGLTLGGGGAKGFAHIGFYQALFEAGIPIHSIAGCSIGGLVGAAIAQGKTPQEIYEVMTSYVNQNGNFFRFSNLGFETGTFWKVTAELQTLHRLIPEDLEFKDLKIPLIVNAVDLESGEQKAFNSGNVAQAVFASMSLPGVFPPVFYEDHLYVDGGILNSIPVDLCKTLGADLQVAVDLKSFYSEQNMSGLVYHFYMQKDQDEKDDIHRAKKGLKERVQSNVKDILLKASFPFHVMLRSMCIAEEASRMARLEKAKPDFVVHPDVSGYNFLDASKHLEMYGKGLEAGAAWVPKIRQAVLNPSL